MAILESMSSVIHGSVFCFILTVLVGATVSRMVLRMVLKADQAISGSWFDFGYGMINIHRVAFHRSYSDLVVFVEFRFVDFSGTKYHLMIAESYIQDSMLYDFLRCIAYNVIYCRWVIGESYVRFDYLIMPWLLRRFL